MDEVVQARYDPAQWNIYAAQASDGDNWADDSPLCHELLAKKILPVVLITAISKLPAGRIRPCGASMNTCRRPLIISPCSIFATRRISTRYSANCFTSSHLKVKLN
ncbi:YeaH [Klebsiella pneumoniae]|uniref:YeaH n=1 Tax=Klebsiella pneumoniae TaxID=573 RepID=A0A378BCY2_KLEPN|nr:YeaH [Klebsiella pneumoniae]